MRSPRTVLAAALVGLGTVVAGTVSLHQAAMLVLTHALEERLSSAGRTAALYLRPGEASPSRLEALRAANDLEAALVVGPALDVLSDASGRGTRPANLLRFDPVRLEAALAGDASVGFTQSFGRIPVGAGYFPLQGPEGQVLAVLVLEAGDAFGHDLPRLDWALAAVSVSTAVVVLLLVLVWRRWLSLERAHQADSLAAAGHRVLAQLASMAAHEIRNPLGIIQGTVERLRTRLGVGVTPRDAAALEDILGEVRRLDRLTGDLLDLGRQRPLDRADVDLRRVLEDALGAVRDRVPGAVLALKEGEAAPLEADAGRLRQVFINLLLNAAQSADRVHVTVELRRQPGALVVRVEDDGPGVPEAVRDRLFEPFVSGRANGHGLGLALSRALVEQHGGRLQLVRGGPGAVFEVWLPERAPAP